MTQFQENTRMDRMTEGWTEGRTARPFYSTLPATAGVPKNVFLLLLVFHLPCFAENAVRNVGDVSDREMLLVSRRNATLQH